MTITFITGANKGLGYETARRLIEAGHTVIVGARDPERGMAAAKALGARFVAIDVSSDSSVREAAENVAEHEGHVDVLVNNAGIAGPAGGSVEDLDGTDAALVFDTNVFGVVRTTNAFVPLLRKSAAPQIVNVTSGLGSFTAVHDPDRVESTVVLPLYTASKSAVTMLSVQYAKGLDGIRVNAVDPGYTATDLNANSGAQTITEGTDAIVALALEGPEAGTGRYVDRNGPAVW